MDIRPYWVWMQMALGVRARVDEILSVFPSPITLYDAGTTEWKLSGVLTPIQIRKLSQTDIEKANQVVRLCDINGWKIITPDHSLYPPLLLEICDYPIVLYVWGDLSCLKNKISIAVVGTRTASRHSINVAGRLCASLTRSGSLVVSGGALGIDSAAHTGALYAGGKTVAVLGCGLAAKYLMENQAMRKNISENGAVISEYLPDTKPLGQNFPIRNRIISGLSYGTVVIEAGERSGSLITARLANEQGRDVFAVPGDIISSCFTGANRLIADGARPIFSASDILCDYAVTYPELLDINKIENTLDFEAVPLQNVKSSTRPKIKQTISAKNANGNNKPPKAPVVKKSYNGKDENVKKVFNCFDANPMQTDDIVRKSGLDTKTVLEALTRLEICDLIQLQSGNRYTLK
ncbi:MAG TPA: DNA-processing protein DprA [Clostridia bacterium]|nr:DNA-processing protein DprA [Clostridia bacterium]